MALNYILSMKPDLEARDCFGYTPLHIAVTCVEKLGSTRNVKALLLRGADRKAIDLNNKMPVEHISESLEDDVINDLTQQLGPQSYWECLMMRVPLIPLKRNHKTQALFLTMFTVIFLLNLFVILPMLEAELSYIC